MTVVERLPTSTRGRLGLVAVAATLWLLAYWVNGRLWGLVLYDVAGLERDERLSETLHFFLYDTIKITLLLSGIIFVVTVAALLHERGAHPRPAGWPARGRRERDGGRPGGRHPVLLLQRRARPSSGSSRPACRWASR